jgi:predicted DCC family thiol-disulfide oxidoreductase YuxK
VGVLLQLNAISGLVSKLIVHLSSQYRFSALQSETGKALLERSGRRSDDISSIVLVDEAGSYIKSDAILRISQVSSCIKSHSSLLFT